jgi:hypothetical protein
MNHRTWFLSLVTNHRNLGGLRLVALTLTAVLCLLATPAHAAPPPAPARIQVYYTVNNIGAPAIGTPAHCPQYSTPTNTGAGTCTLRDAIAAANAATSVTTTASINFDPSLTSGTLPAVIPICQTCGPYQISGYITIAGPSGSIPVEIQGTSADYNMSSTVFQQFGGQFALTGNPSAVSLIIMNGGGLGAWLGTGTGTGSGGLAGGVEINSGVFAATNVKFMNNYGLGGGAIFNISTTDPKGSSVATPQSAVVQVVNCDFEDNSTGINSIFGSVLVENSTFSGNAATPSANPTPLEAGGGIWAWGGSVTVQNSSFYHNSNNNNDVLATLFLGGASGGAISVGGFGSLTVSGSTFAYNSAVTQGGAVFIDPTVTAATFTNSTFYNNTVTSNYNSRTKAGGGAAIFAASPLTLLQVTLQDPNPGYPTSYDFVAVDNLALVNSLYYNGGVNGGTLNSVGSVNSDPPISGLGNFGGPTQTMMPLLNGTTPSAAICGGRTTDLGDDATGSNPITLPLTDQRGYPRVGSVGGYPCVDAGAVQTAYALQWTASPSNPQIGGTTMTASTSPTTTYPAVQLVESGSPIALSGEQIPVQLPIPPNPQALSGTTSVATDANGVATFSALTSPHVTTAIPNDYLLADIYFSVYTGSGTSVLENTYPSAYFDLIDLVLPATTLSGGTVGSSYSQTINPPTGGVGSPTYTVTAGSLPQGLILNSSTGAITGTPYSVPATNPASFTITASFSDGSSIAQTYSITIAKGTPAVVISLSAGSNPVFQSNPVSFMATVALSSPSGPVAIPSGTATFYVGSTVLCSPPATLNGGEATCTSTSLGQGSNVIAASYSGDSNYNAVAYTASTSLTEIVMGLLLTPVQTALTVIPGQSTAYTINVTTTPTGSSSTFPAPANFAVTCTSCSSGVWPTGVTPDLNPTSMSSSGPLTLTINTTLQANLTPVDAGPGIGKRLAPLALALLLLPFARRLRKVSRRLSQIGLALLLAVLSLAVATGVSGCGAAIGFFGSPQQSYNLQVTATSGSYSTNTTVTLTVE